MIWTLKTEHAKVFVIAEALMTFLIGGQAEVFNILPTPLSDSERTTRMLNNGIRIGRR